MLGHYQTLLENEEESIEMSNVMLDVGLTGDMIDIGAAHDKLLTHIKTCFHLPVIYCLLKKKHFSPYLMLDLYFSSSFSFSFFNDYIASYNLIKQWAQLRPEISNVGYHFLDP